LKDPDYFANFIVDHDTVASPISAPPAVKVRAAPAESDPMF